MKKTFIALLPFLLAAQLPMNALTLIPDEWMKSIHYGLKWTQLMVNGYPGASEAATEKIPAGQVTTVITLAHTIPELPEIQPTIDEYLCDVEFRKELAVQARTLAKMQVELEKVRLQQVRVRLISM